MQRSLKSNKLRVVFVLCLQLFFAQVYAVTTTTLYEQALLSGQNLRESSSTQYVMRVTTKFLQSGQSLAISAIAASFGSDPDIFISKVRSFFFYV